MKAVHEHADALRAAIASPGNDHRLGANEAPPAIISVFLGGLLDKIFQNIEKGEASQATEAQILNLGIGHIPDVAKDYTDRNRTSPFAFTGNKFEFRAVGASANVAVPLTILNAAVADAFSFASTKLRTLMGKGSRDEAVMELIRELTKETKSVRFEGNNYSEEWQKEAKKRNLPVLNSTVEAVEVFNNPKACEFLVSTKVLTAPEIASRNHIAVERYNKTLEIELHTLGELVVGYVVPALEKQIMHSKQAEGAMSGKAKELQAGRLQRLDSVFAEAVTQLNALHEVLARVSGEHDET
jgi:glutamine synthetase